MIFNINCVSKIRIRFWCFVITKWTGKTNSSSIAISSMPLVKTALTMLWLPSLRAPPQRYRYRYNFKNCVFFETFLPFCSKTIVFHDFLLRFQQACSSGGNVHPNLAVSPRQSSFGNNIPMPMANSCPPRSAKTSPNLGAQATPSEAETRRSSIFDMGSPCVRSPKPFLT